MTESVSIQNHYGYAVGPQAAATPIPGGSNETFYVASQLPGLQSETGVNYTATADRTGFFFLHDNYCVGSCNTYSQTVITFTLHNDGDSPVNLRFDSQITPGHIARILGNEAMNGSFDFRVTQSTPVSSFEDAATAPLTLYSATGGVNSDGIFLSTGDLAFNGLTETNDPDGRWEVLDWGTTNLNLELATLGSGQTTQVTYIATYNTLATAECASVLSCQGLQVVFGDPRNNGGVNLRTDASNLDDALYPVIGRVYDPHFVTAQIVSADTPLPGQPGAPPPTNYGPLFDPRVIGVPEPGTWAMMFGGFGLIGASLRRRKARLAIV
ncbi:PEPxxWA-CTERM sorting domain-containing protein [Sphingomonas sp.]|uniref:PEPxxWA-CTERM sorting domain-containing protein n=1 Tax=Sphingomonas sp. TaxID=28214 RepID=UPI002DBBE33A|nr:PEPxxWA-CTERM sorting domain-containing protein [Sphingomonas sp.]HEU4968907.1 PEPxxWA-CTERM sorting domain-containing protein [Sphingomonas sp.]